MLYRSIFTVAAVLIFACVSFAQGDLKGEAAADALKFPEVEGWRLGPRIVIPIRGGGYYLNYESPEGGRVTVYVYDHGYPEIPNDLTGPVREELDGAIQAINTVAEMGAYEEVKQLEKGTVTLGGSAGKVKALKAAFEIKPRGRERIRSDIYLFAYRHNIVKIRHSGPAGSGEAETAKLLAALDALFADPLPAKPADMRSIASVPRT